MTWYTLCTRTLSGANQGFNGETPRQTWDVASYAIGAPSTGTQLRLTFQAGPTGGLNWTSLYIGHRATSGDNTDFDGTQVQVLTSTSASGSIGSANGTLTTDGATYTFSKTKPLVAAFVCTFPGNCRPTTDADIHIAHTFDAASVTDATVSGSVLAQVIIPTVEVWFDDPAGNPTCSIDKASGQADPTSGTSVAFLVRFNKGVTGFTSADCNMSSSTVTWMGGSPTIVVTGSDFAFLVTITGMLTIGNVVLNVAAAVCTAVSDGLPNDAATIVDNSIAWDPDIIGPNANVYDVCIVNRQMLRFEVRDPVVALGHFEELSSPLSTGGGTFAISGVVDNGKGLCRVTCAAWAPNVDNVSITDMTSSPVSNGTGGQKIRCTVWSTSGISGSATIRGATGTLEANGSWAITVIDSTHFDLDSSTFTNTYLGHAMVELNASERQRIALHSIGGTTEANGAWIPMRSGTNTFDLRDSHFVNTYTSGGILCQLLTWVLQPNSTLGGANDYCFIVGRDCKHLRFQDPIITVDRMFEHEPAWVAANYSMTGGYTITNVFKKAKPYSTGRNSTASLTFGQPSVSFRHYIYLELSANLVNGTYTVVFPTGANLPPKTFTYNDKTTRCCAIHVDQNGHRPSDPGKLGYLSEWVPDYPSGSFPHGGMDFSAVTAWYLIDGTGTTVATFGAPVLRATPTSVEGSEYTGVGGAFPRTVDQNRNGAAMKVSSVTSASNALVTVDDASSLSNGDMISFSQMWHWADGQTGVGTAQSGHFGMWQISSDNDSTPLVYRVVSKSGNTFNLGTIKGVFQSGVAIASGGSGYAVNDLIILSSFTDYRMNVTLKVATVSGGVVTSVTIVDNETRAIALGYIAPVSVLRTVATGFLDYPYTAPTNPRSQVSTTGSGTGATFNLTWADNPWDRSTVPGGFCFGSPDSTLTPYGTISTTTAQVFAQSGSHDRGNLCYKINDSANRAGTYVYGLDYATFTTAGTYRIYIPNVGVSDPINISESRWWRANKEYLVALYHERSGCSLDGRFGGYTRPFGMKSRTGYPIYKSYMPYCWSNYNVDPPGTTIPDIGLQFGGGGYGPWITTTEATQFGSHQDAGDFDTRLNETCWGYWQILDTYEHLPTAAKAAFVSQGTPTCLAAGLDPTLYAGTDGIPSPLVEVIWGIDQMRQSQEVSGAVSGGLNYGEGVVGFDTSNNMQMSLYAWYPDHLITYDYVFVAAKLARLLLAAGFTSIGNTFAASALAGYDWATTIQTDSTARDAYYAPVKLRAGWDTTTYNAAVSQLLSMCNRDRANAAASMFALTGGSTYKTYCDSFYPPTDFDVRTAFGGWEYANAAGANTTIRDATYDLVKTKALSAFLVGAESPSVTYTNGQNTGVWSMGFGQGNNWIHNMCVLERAAIRFAADGNTTDASRCRRAMQWYAGHRHGANQLGLCMVNGIGVRHNLETLHVDSRHTGQDLPLGMCSEGWANNFPVNLGLGDSFISAIQHPQYDSSSLPVDPTVVKRELYPYEQLGWPRWEFFIESYSAVEHSEFTTQQQLLPAYAATMFLSGFDGNAETEEEPPPEEIPVLPITSRRRFVSFNM